MRSSRAGIYERNIFPNNRAPRRGQTSSKRPGPANSYLMDAIYLAFGKFYCSVRLCKMRSPLNLRLNAFLFYMYKTFRRAQKSINELSAWAWMCQICNKNKCFLFQKKYCTDVHAPCIMRYGRVSELGGASAVIYEQTRKNNVTNDFLALQRKLMCAVDPLLWWWWCSWAPC